MLSGASLTLEILEGISWVYIDTKHALCRIELPILMNHKFRCQLLLQATQARHNVRLATLTYNGIINAPIFNIYLKKRNQIG